MNRTHANMMADFINEGSHNIYQATSIFAYVEEDGETYRVIVEPSVMNESPSCFHHMEVITNMARAFNAHCYATIKAGKIIVELF